MTDAGPEPRTPPGLRMRWDNLLFLHWPVDPAVIRALVPQPYEIDLYDGRAWVALVPFRMEDTSFRAVPPLPGLSAFYECNVRTYVRIRAKDGSWRAGVWFLSLDAERLIPVLGARWFWSLNYIHSRFDVRGPGYAPGASDHVPPGGNPERWTTDYRLVRRRNPAERTRVVWTREDEMPLAPPDSLEYFLTERYWLFTIRHGRPMGGRITHPQWKLRRATVSHVDDTLMASAGIQVSGEPLAWHSDTISVRAWWLSRI